LPAADALIEPGLHFRFDPTDAMGGDLHALRELAVSL
jgi:hypothetical protein